MKHLFTAAVAASALLVSACADEPEVAEVDETAMVDPVAEPMAEPGGAAWDTNADGVFQQAEYTAWGDRGITGWDTDGDAMLSETEFNAGWTEAGFNEGNTVFAAWDDDADGFLSDDEFFDDEEWTEWDADSSGALETTEFTYY